MRSILYAIGFLLLLMACPAFAAGAPAGAAASFETMLTNPMAPYTLHVNATEIPLTHGTPLTAKYEWDFGDTTAGSRYNQLPGWIAAHVYTEPGTYTVALTLTDEAGEKRLLKKVFIIEPDTRQTIFVAANGRDSDTGLSPYQPIRSLALAVRKSQDDTRILLRCGDIFDVADKIDIKHNNVLIGSYALSSTATTSPADSNPVIRFVGELKYVPIFQTTKEISDLTIQDVTFDSKFTHNTEKTGMPDCLRPGGENTTVRNCVFLNVGYGINCNEYPHGVMAIDNSCPLVTGLRSYFAWIQGSDQVYLGNYVSNSTREHCIRCGGADRLLLAYNTLTNLDRRPEDKIDTAKGCMTIHAGTFAYIARNNLVRSGELLLGPLGQRDGLKNPSSRFKWAVIEDNKIDSFVYINHGVEHLMCRNNIVRRNDWACFVVEGYNEQYQRGNSDVTIENNTGINKSVRGNFLRVTGKVDGITLLNNLYIAPKLKLEDDFSAPVFVDDTGLGSFRQIAGNIWPDLTGFKGVNYVKGMGGYITEDQWKQSPTVKDDRFEKLPVPTTVPTTSPTTLPAGVGESCNLSRTGDCHQQFMHDLVIPFASV